MLVFINGLDTHNQQSCYSCVFIHFEYPSTVCNGALCHSKMHTCPFGYLQEVVMGVCCPKYECGEWRSECVNNDYGNIFREDVKLSLSLFTVPNPNVCVFNNTEYKVRSI